MLNILQDVKCASTTQTLIKTDLFNALPSDISASLISAAKNIFLNKNDALFLQHDSARWFYFIVSGWVKIYRETQDGEEAVIELLGEGDFVNESSFLEDNHYTSNAAAAEKTHLIRLPIALLEEATKRSHKTALAMLSAFAIKRQRQAQELEGLKLQNAPQRIGCFLLRQCGGKLNGTHSVSLPYGKSLIATQLGMKGETFSRALKKLKAATHVDVQGSKVHVPEVLELADFVCAGCSNEYPCKEFLLDPRQKSSA